jgi:hypothetical protein
MPIFEHASSHFWGQPSCQASGNCGFRRSDRSDNNLRATVLKSFCRPLTHSRTNHHFATVKGGENSRIQPVSQCSSRLSTTDRYMHELAGPMREVVQNIEKLILLPHKRQVENEIRNSDVAQCGPPLGRS